MVLKITEYKYFPIFVYILMPVFKWCPGFPQEEFKSGFLHVENTRWFKYDRDWFVQMYTQISPGHIWTTLYYITWEPCRLNKK